MTPTDIEVREIIVRAWRLVSGASASTDLAMGETEWAYHVAIYRRGWNDAMEAQQVAVGDATERMLSERNRSDTLKRAGIKPD